MTKTRIVNGILSGMLALYAVFIFVVTKYPRLTNFNDSFYFINWWALPLLTILLLISWLVTFKHDSSFFAFKCISIAAGSLWGMLWILFFCNAPLPYDAIFNNQPVLSVLLMLMWMVAVWKSKEKHA